MKKLITKTTIITLGLFTLSGCLAPIENVVRYTPPTSQTVSNDKSGIPLKVQYSLGGDSTTFRTIYYHIFNGKNNKLLLSDAKKGKMNLEDTLGVTNLRILGTIGDKIVFSWRNGGGNADSYLSVYDFSEKRTYHILKNDEKFSILQNGNSYVIKDISNNRFISLNNLKEVKINEANYKVLPLRRYYTGLNNRGRTGKLKTVFTPDKLNWLISSPVEAYGKLDKLMFGDYPITRR